MAGLMKSLFGGSSDADTNSGGGASGNEGLKGDSKIGIGLYPERAAAVGVTLLVLDAGLDNWAEIFKGSKLTDGRAVRVVQTGWDSLLVTSESHGFNAETRVHLKGGGSIKPDFLLVRNEVRGVDHRQDHRNSLLGLMFGGIPSVNSLHSIYMFCDRPVVQAELNRMARALGDAKFPLIRQAYFASYREMMYTQSFPAVAKVGHAHAGMGKMVVSDHHAFEDFRSVMAMTDGKYVTCEPFLEGEYDIRLQRIGTACRAYKRVSVSGNWKTNTGTSICEEVEVTPLYREWLDAASQMFGGLDICTVDAIHDRESGKEYILEVNGTSSGLAPDNAEVDNRQIKDLTLAKMNAEL